MQIKLDETAVDGDVLCKHYGASTKTIMLSKIYVLPSIFIYMYFI